MHNWVERESEKRAIEAKKRGMERNKQQLEDELATDQVEELWKNLSALVHAAIDAFDSQATDPNRRLQVKEVEGRRLSSDQFRGHLKIGPRVPGIKEWSFNTGVINLQCWFLRVGTIQFTQPGLESSEFETKVRFSLKVYSGKVQIERDFAEGPREASLTDAVKGMLDKLIQ